MRATQKRIMGKDYLVNVKRCELDTRASTRCAGKNFRVLSLTEQTCDVQGFHNSFQAHDNIPIAIVATGYSHESGMMLF